MNSLFSLTQREWKLQTPAPIAAAFPFGVVPTFFASLVYSLLAVCRLPESAVNPFAAVCLPVLRDSTLTLDHGKLAMFAILAIMRLAEMLQAQLTAGIPVVNITTKVKNMASNKDRVVFPNALKIPRLPNFKKNR